MQTKTILFVFGLVAVIAIAKAQGLGEGDMDDTQHEGNGRYARSPYHHEGGSGGGGGGGSGGGSPNGGHNDEVEYGAHTGDKGAFEWHAHYPVGHH